MLHPWFDPSHDEFSNPMRDARTDLLADSQPDLQADSPAGSQKDVRLNALADALADPFRRRLLSAALLSATGGALAMAGWPLPALAASTGRAGGVLHGLPPALRPNRSLPGAIRFPMARRPGLMPRTVPPSKCSKPACITMACTSSPLAKMASLPRRMACSASITNTPTTACCTSAARRTGAPKKWLNRKPLPGFR